ncbi:MAG: tetratricopeptide repeat protein [bacterium]
MYKRKKRKYGIFHTARKKQLKIFKASLILIFFWVFFGILQGKADSITAAPVFNAAVGFIYSYNGNYSESIKYFNKESTNLLKNSYFNYTLAALYFKNREYQKSLKHINLALKENKLINKNNKLSKTEIKYLILKAKIMTNQGNIKESVALLKHILQKNPYNLKTLLFLSNLYIYKKDLKTAVFYLDIIKLSAPDSITAYYLLSKIYLAQNIKEKAEHNLISVINIDPYFKKAYFRLAALYILTGREKKAINIFNKYLKINPYSKTAIYQSAILEYTLKNYPASRKHFLNFIDIAKNSKNNSRLINNAYFFTGISYILQKNYKKGLFYLNKLKPGRHYIDAQLQEIEIYITDYKKTGDIKYRKSIEGIISEILSDTKVNKNLKFYYFSAVALAEIKDYPMSVYVVKRGLLKFPDNTALLYELGSAYHT